MLHTNYPGHADFNSYMKCNFVIYCSDGKSSIIYMIGLKCNSYIIFCYEKSEKSFSPFPAGGGSFQDVNNSKQRVITPSTKWEQVKVSFYPLSNCMVA